MKLGISSINLPERRICVSCGKTETADEDGFFKNLTVEPVRTVSLQELTHYQGDHPNAVRLREEVADEGHIIRGAE
ncbi:MAG TPA: hypothetical protein VNA68_01280 [Candidatus Dormibacteraeota bacterium]|nr:hypothetical protein [Candidatus Dormibacteraeota bacterium]